MIGDSDLGGIGLLSEGRPMAAMPAPRKRRAGTRRMIGFASLALPFAAAAILLTPGLRAGLRTQAAARADLARPAVLAADPETLPAVPVLWEKLNLAGLPVEAAQDLRQGKYYYDKRLPGNFGLAIDYWKKAEARLKEAGPAELKDLVESAEAELARQFNADSADVFVLLKQGKRDYAVTLLERMRADYIDIGAPQHVWASQTLYRRRR